MISINLMDQIAWRTGVKRYLVLPIPDLEHLQHHKYQNLMIMMSLRGKCSEFTMEQYITKIYNNHADTPVLDRLPKLSNIKHGQYQMGDHLKIPGAICRRTLTHFYKNCKTLMEIDMQVGSTCEFDIPIKLPLLEEASSTQLE